MNWIIALLVILICIVAVSVWHLKSILESSSKEEDEEEYMSESDLEKKFSDIGSSITALEAALKTAMGSTRDDVTKTLKEFELIFKSSQERGNLGEYRIEQLLSDLGLIEGTHWKAKQKHKDHGTIPDYTFYFPDGVFVNLDSKFPLEHYKNMFNEGISEVDKNEEKKKFRVDVKARINELKKPGYIDVSNGSVDFVLLLLPSDSVLNFVRKEFESLDNNAKENHIFIIGLNELYAILSMLDRAIKNFEANEKQSEIVENFHKASGILEDIQDNFGKEKDRIDLMSRKFKDIIKSLDLLAITLKLLDKDDEDENSGSSSAPAVPPSNKEE